MMDMQAYATALEVVYIFRELEEIRKYREDVHAGVSQIMMTGGNGLSIWLNTSRGSLVKQKLWETLLRELDALIEKYEKELKELLKDESSRMVAARGEEDSAAEEEVALHPRGEGLPHIV